MTGADPTPPKRQPALVRGVWLVLGLICVGLGVVGALLPLMPTTVFLILAAGCFARSSPRLEAWLLNHKRFGPTLRAWRANGAIPRKAKIAACLGIGVGYLIFIVGAHPRLVLELIVGTVMAACALFIVTRPAPPVQAR
jgi:uncharacterized membrane protein YbaN (DUF454 family)